MAARRALPARRAAADGARPDDWACKLHVALAPVYYHNYLLGEITASQLEWALARETGVAEPGRRAGRRRRVPARALHAPGASLRWDELIEHATGSPLSVDHLADWLAGR